MNRSPSAAAERMRQYRKRHRKGLRCIRILLEVTDIDVLVLGEHPAAYFAAALLKHKSKLTVLHATLPDERSPDRLVVAYGGAMHNDLLPREGRADFSFGPSLAEATGGQYVELDLVIPEQIKDTDAWRARGLNRRTGRPRRRVLFQSSGGGCVARSVRCR